MVAETTVGCKIFFGMSLDIVDKKTAGVIGIIGCLLGAP